MKSFRKICATILLVLMFALPVFAGDIPFPGYAGDPETPGYKGDPETPGRMAVSFQMKFVLATFLESIFNG
ncbi:MAG TPA: hypothetical protein VGC91_19825 [Pyrinomonadaceae bacterium]|jgi:hypothetical protein